MNGIDRMEVQNQYPNIRIQCDKGSRLKSIRKWVIQKSGMGKTG